MDRDDKTISLTDHRILLGEARRLARILYWSMIPSLWETHLSEGVLATIRATSWLIDRPEMVDDEHLRTGRPRGRRCDVSESGRKQHIAKMQVRDEMLDEARDVARMLVQEIEDALGEGTLTSIASRCKATYSWLCEPPSRGVADQDLKRIRREWRIHLWASSDER